MRKTGFVKKELIVTLKDHPGVISVVLHTDVRKCQLNCYKCHNKHSVDKDEVLTFFSESELRQKLNIIKNINTELIIISGGEPTLSDSLEEDLNIFKEEELPVRLDTNGLNYTLVEDLIHKRLIQGIALDIKIPIKETYIEEEILRFNKILFSIESDNESIIKEYGRSIEECLRIMEENKDNIPYTLLRTVEYPCLTKQDKDEIELFVSQYSFKHYFNTFFEI